MLKKTTSSNRLIGVIVVVSILLIAGIASIIVLTSEVDEEPVVEQVIDDQISPYTNQAIFLEIHRIRKKGIIDQMQNAGLPFFKNLPINNEKLSAYLDGLRPGFGWDKKPVYTYIATLDGYEYEGRDRYTDWDTGYMNQEVWRNVMEESTDAIVEIKIIEFISQKQLLKTITSKKEMDSFQVMYDFKTGHWSGDDSFNDSDGYGHYIGSHYEIWFTLTQTTPDNDIIPYWTEVNVLGTDPLVDDTKLDPDEDGIPTVWEWKWGYDPFTPDNHTTLDPDHDGLQNIEEYKMEKWLANPYHPEIYIEADWMAPTPKIGRFRPNPRTEFFIPREGYDGWVHTFYTESQQMLMDKFTEHGYTLHIDDGTHGELSRNGGGDILPFGRGNAAYSQEHGVVAGFYNNDFSDERKGIFRYVVIAYGGGWCHPQDDNHWYDCMCVPHNQKFYINQLGAAMSERAIRIGQAVSIMHELGHSLGMLSKYFEGVDNSIHKADDPNEYPYLDYVSCMNYDYFGMRYLDYSDGSNGEYDKDDWESLDLTFFQTPSEEMEGLGAYDDPLEEDPVPPQYDN